MTHGAGVLGQLIDVGGGTGIDRVEVLVYG
jgi:hypothetical protein